MFALVNAHPVEGLTLSLGGRFSHDRKKYDIATQVRTNVTPVGNLTGDAYTEGRDTMGWSIAGSQAETAARILEGSLTRWRG